MIVPSRSSSARPLLTAEIPCSFEIGKQLQKLFRRRVPRRGPDIQKLALNRVADEQSLFGKQFREHVTLHAERGFECSGVVELPHQIDPCIYKPWPGYLLTEGHDPIAHTEFHTSEL